MRSNQVEIKIRRFGDEVPSFYNSDKQIISVYADSNNLFEALSVAYSEAIQKLQEYEQIPSFGTVSSCDDHENPWLR
jgi:hypothetical protein